MNPLRNHVATLPTRAEIAFANAIERSKRKEIRRVIENLEPSELRREMRVALRERGLL